MTDQEILAELTDLATRLGIEVRWGTGEFRGGILRLRGTRILYLNTASSPSRSVELLSGALRGEDLSGHFLLPAVRRRLENGALIS